MAIYQSCSRMLIVGAVAFLTSATENKANGQSVSDGSKIVDAQGDPAQFFLDPGRNLRHLSPLESKASQAIKDGAYANFKLTIPTSHDKDDLFDRPVNFAFGGRLELVTPFQNYLLDRDIKHALTETEATVLPAPAALLAIRPPLGQIACVLGPEAQGATSAVVFLFGPQMTCIGGVIFSGHTKPPWRIEFRAMATAWLLRATMARSDYGSQGQV